MPLSAGTRLGPYEIVAPLGAGGMGEVYRARDTRLHRDVAIKVLPELFASDPERLTRLQREAQVLASLNHPHIAIIHGLEEAAPSTLREPQGPAEQGRAPIGSGQTVVRALVMELVEGEDLTERIARGPMPLDQALPIARQILGALEAAHERGIIHRDLKPANVKVRADDTVKVLDFGLAKAMVSGSAASPSAMNSPTLSIHATEAGIILGTVAYMSPEQAAGKPVDRRTDLWAFAVLLFEMLTGRPVFTGETASHVLASVLKTEPDWTALPAGTPAPLRRLLRRCLEKDRKRRLDSAADARLEIDEALAPIGEANPIGVVMPSAWWRRALPWAIAGALALGLMVVTALWAPWRAAAPPRVTRTTITTSSQAAPAALTVASLDRGLALSPDGRHVVYAGNGGTQLFVRALDALEPVAIASEAVLRAPFVSPDGQWVGFLSGTTTLKKVAIAGGPSITLADLDGNGRGMTWASDDTIVFATANPATGLQRVSAAGGTPEVLTQPDRTQGEGDHLWPEILPGGHVLLFTIMSPTGGLDAAQLVARDLRTGTQKVLLRGGSHAHYVASGHLVYVGARTLRAIAFDAERLETYGTAVPVLSRLVTRGTGTGEFFVATNGTLLYADATATLAASARTLVWVDRTGKEEPIAAPARAYQQPRLSPDGTRLALWSSDGEDDLWIWDLRRATLTLLTTDAPGMDRFPVWTPDSRRVIFTSDRGGGVLNLWWQMADAAGTAEQLTTSGNSQFPSAITPDGTAVLLFEGTPTLEGEMVQLALAGTRRVTPLFQTKSREFNGIVSPDGRWLAYESNSSGRFDIYVRPFPNVGDGQSQVSTLGGTRPLWARNGKELFYVGADGALMRVPVEASGAVWNAGTPTKLFEGRYVNSGTAGRTYDVSADGQRFLMIKPPASDPMAATTALIVVQHWDEELKRLVPTRRAGR